MINCTLISLLQVFTWRLLIGPVNKHLSIFAVFCENISSNHVLLCFSEITMFRFLMLFGWKHFNSINEEFIFNFINLFNICFIFGSQISRLILGKLYFSFRYKNLKFNYHISFDIRFFWECIMGFFERKSLPSWFCLGQ